MSVKSSFADAVYREFLHENYGIESCGFKGYGSLTGLLLDTFIIGDCKKITQEIESVKLCSCTPPCEEYDPYKVCSCKYK